MAPGDDHVTSDQPDELAVTAERLRVEQVDLPVLDERRLHAVAGAIATLLHDRGPDDVPGLVRRFAATYGLHPYLRLRLPDAMLAALDGSGRARLANALPEVRAALEPPADAGDAFAPYRPEASREGSPFDLVIRQGTLDDTQATAGLLARTSGADPARIQLGHRRMVNDPRSVLFVAEVAGDVAGFGIATHEPRPDDAPENAAPAGYYLMGLAVDPAWRRRGIAEALCRARMEWVWQRDDTVWFFASAANATSLALHEKLGFREVTRDFWHPGVRFQHGGVLCVAHRP